MIVRVSQCEIVLARRSLKNLEPSARVSLQYDRLYVENEIYLYNEIEQRVERMIIGKKEVEVEFLNLDRIKTSFCR